MDERELSVVSYEKDLGGLDISRAFQQGQKKFRFDSRYRIHFFDSIRFGNLINLPLVH